MAAQTVEERDIWLTEEQQAAWRHYLEGTARFVEALGSVHDRTLPLSLGEYSLLVQLSEAPDRTMRMSTLADGLVLSRSRLTHTVARMEARGLVSRCAAEGDRRGVNCAMTEAGYAALVAAAPGHVSAVRRILVEALEPEEFEMLGRVMAKVAASSRAAGGTEEGLTVLCD
ncbi:MarR family winged helix-turn-helix transcriptional regulator [Promicromonospora thailandica]|uniref:DNA-binding transcriptional regulator, MarR family n=1 Tax=Promicromonospora thailandica TaxID=765201 RepID=A0A9X2FYU2_9MICO|nr:MarR family transcriptional regulator [Promicromonospora thailandica]MCP2263684.1 DNA-binding transcriptional regulator, MarR family [Promicromonospora thailandica]BFF19111.1 MarR family transcriptional regulator [Promicromonospora thailandica]